jgi:hypothetical protein
MIIGTPKSLDELQTFSVQELEELFKGMEQYITSGVPMEVPAAIPIGQLGRIVVTLRRYHAMVKRAAGAEDGLEAPGMDEITDRWAVLSADAQALLDAAAPKEQKIVQAKSSRLVLPK